MPYSQPRIRTYDLLDQIVTILGGTKLGFWPFLTAVGTMIYPYGSGNDGLVLTPTNALQTNFDPVPLNGIYALYSDSAAPEAITGADNAAYTHGNGTVDTAFSCGCWLLFTQAIGSFGNFLSKWDITTGVEAREWQFYYDTSGNLVLALYDETNNASETGTGAGDVLVPWTWNFVVATYDGTETAPAVHLYRNAVDQLASGATTEAGTYTAMNDTASLFRVGSQEGAGGTATIVADGYIALPFVTGKELTAAEVTSLYGLGRTLIGV